MKTWLVTEKQVDYWIKNCSLMLESEKNARGDITFFGSCLWLLYAGDCCIIRRDVTSDPLSFALYHAVTSLTSMKEARRFVKTFRSFLITYKNPMGYGDEVVERINKKAIEIDVKA